MYTVGVLDVARRGRWVWWRVLVVGVVLLATIASTPAALASRVDRVSVSATTIGVQLTQVATLDQPIAMAARTGDTSLYVAEKTGRVMAVRNGAVDPNPALDLSTVVSHGSE